MNTEQDLMQRLAVSKKIMEKHSQISRSSNPTNQAPSVDTFDSVNAKYNLPEEFLPEQAQSRNDFDATKPLDENRILNSKLPDEIKRLMIEQPIVQPNSTGGVEISEEVIQGAQRLMGKTNKITDVPQQTTNKETFTTNNQTTSNINIGEIKTMIRDVVRDAVRDVVKEELKEAGMLVESTSNSDEVIQFKVGKHLFVGKVTKIKKLQ
jgi:hypothetical protein